MIASKPYTTIGYLIADLSRLFGRVFDRRSAHLGLTRVQWRALKRIHQNQGISQAELADLLDMEPIAVGRVVDRLQKSGFIERRSDPQPQGNTAFANGCGNRFGSGGGIDLAGHGSTFA